MNRLQQVIEQIKLWHIVTIYTGAFVVAFPFFRYQINPDCVAYIGVAQQYVNGNLTEAVNGYWSPLICWLLTPLILLHIPTLIAFKCLNFIAGGLSLLFVQRIGKQLQFNKTSTTLTSLLLIPHILMFVLCINTPDVLAFCTWLVVIYLTLKCWANPDYKTALLLGVAGFLAYVSKYYQFYTFILIIAITIITAIFVKKTLIRYYAVAFIGFILLSLPWILLLQNKYGYITPSTASTFNISMVKQPEPPHPAQIGDTLLNLNYKNYVYTSWEEPSYYTITQWNPLNSFKDLKNHVGGKVIKNAHYISSFYYIELLVLLIALFFIIKNKPKWNTTQLLISGFAIIYPLAYFGIVAEPRYMLFPLLVALLFSTHILITYAFNNKILRITLFLFLSLCFMLPVSRIIRYPQKGQTYHDMAMEINKQTDISHANIISSPSTWWYALYCSYYNSCKFYDSLKQEKLSFYDFKNEDIQYYFCKKEEVTSNQNVVAVSGDFVIIQLY